MNKQAFGLVLILLLNLVVNEESNPESTTEFDISQLEHDPENNTIYTDEELAPVIEVADDGKKFIMWLDQELDPKNLHYPVNPTPRPAPDAHHPLQRVSDYIPVDSYRISEYMGDFDVIQKAYVDSQKKLAEEVVANTRGRRLFTLNVEDPLYVPVDWAEFLASKVICYRWSLIVWEMDPIVRPQRDAKYFAKLGPIGVEEDWGINADCKTFKSFLCIFHWERYTRPYYMMYVPKQDYNFNFWVTLPTPMRAPGCLFANTHHINFVCDHYWGHGLDTCSTTESFNTLATPEAPRHEDLLYWYDQYAPSWWNDFLDRLDEAPDWMYRIWGNFVTWRFFGWDDDLLDMYSTPYDAYWLQSNNYQRPACWLRTMTGFYEMHFPYDHPLYYQEKLPPKGYF